MNIACKLNIVISLFTLKPFNLYVIATQEYRRDFVLFLFILQKQYISLLKITLHFRIKRRIFIAGVSIIFVSNCINMTGKNVMPFNNLQNIIFWVENDFSKKGVHFIRCSWIKHLTTIIDANSFTSNLFKWQSYEIPGVIYKDLNRTKQIDKSILCCIQASR